MSPKTTEAHTISFGPADYLQAARPTASSGRTRSNPAGPAGGELARGVPERSAAEAPAGPTGRSHGNGYLNTGVIDGDAATPPARPEAKVTFSKAGTYNYICLIHPDMKGSIVVG